VSSEAYSSQVLFLVSSQLIECTSHYSCDIRQALESRVEFVNKELHILQDIFVRPLARGEVLDEWKQLCDQHCGQIGGWGFRDKVLKCLAARISV
jgi:hypothetical protein